MATLFESPQATAAAISGVIALIVAIFTSLLTNYATRQKLLRDYKLDFAAETVARQLLKDKEWRLRSFSVIKHHLGGFEDDALRQVLVKAGAIRFTSKKGVELWGLLDRNSERLGLEWIESEPGYSTVP